MEYNLRYILHVQFYSAFSQSIRLFTKTHRSKFSSQGKLTRLQNRTCKRPLSDFFGTTTLSITTLGTKDLLVTLIIMALRITKLCHYAECHCAERYHLFIVVLNVVMLSVVAPFLQCASHKRGSFTWQIFFAKMFSNSHVPLHHFNLPWAPRHSTQRHSA